MKKIAYTAFYVASLDEIYEIVQEKQQAFTLINNV
jgi:hypothetical protein